jgi:hypothetical protein
VMMHASGRSSESPPGAESARRRLLRRPLLPAGMGRAAALRLVEDPRPSRARAEGLIGESPRGQVALGSVSAVATPRLRLRASPGCASHLERLPRGPISRRLVGMEPGAERLIAGSSVPRRGGVDPRDLLEAGKAIRFGAGSPMPEAGAGSDRLRGRVSRRYPRTARTGERNDHGAGDRSPGGRARLLAAEDVPEDA